MANTLNDTLAAVERSLPNPRRPRLSTEMEEQLEPVERRAALVYAEAELAAGRLDALAREFSDGVPDAELLGDTSLVAHIQELRAIAREEGENP